MTACADYNVDVVCPTLHGVQRPAANAAMFGDCRLDQLPLLDVQSARVFSHSGSRFEC